MRAVGVLRDTSSSPPSAPQGLKVHRSLTNAMIPYFFCFFLLGFARVTIGESPMQYIKRCREVGKSIGPMAMEEGCREVRAECMNSPDPFENHQGRVEPNGRNLGKGWKGSMSLAAQLEERVLMATCDSTLGNSCMAAATGAMFSGQDEICREAFTKGPDPGAKESCPNLWAVLQIFHKASMRACKTITPTRRSGRSSVEGNGGGGAALG